jgi:Ca2+-binding RTX toxin-like protein
MARCRLPIASRGALLLLTPFVVPVDLVPMGFVDATPVPMCHGYSATIVGTAGDDVLTGTTGADVIVGLGGNDTIFGDAGDDIICGGDNGEEFHSNGYPLWEDIAGGDGDDMLYGGRGRDRLVSGRGNDVLFGGAGIDGLAGVNRDEDRGRGGFDRLYGGSGNDRLRAWTSRVAMYGGGGGDLLEGDDHGDRLYGGPGEDRLAGDAGDDRIAGGPGVDIVDYRETIGFASWGSHRSDITVNLTRGVASGKGFGTDRLDSNIEGAYTGGGSDTLIGDRGRNIFYAGYGDRSTIDGRGGRDLLTFAALQIDGSCCAPVRLDLAAGVGRTVSPYGGVTRVRVRGVEDVQGSGTDDVLLGDAGPNRLVGGPSYAEPDGGGNDLLDGRGGGDALIGGGGDDDLRGGPGDDTLTGDAGDDRIDGGSGRNWIDGGPGKDICLRPGIGPGCD